MAIFSTQNLIVSSSAIIAIAVAVSVLPGWFSAKVLEWQHETRCYRSVTTLSTIHNATAECFTFGPAGVFTDVFDDTTSYPVMKEGTRFGYAYPGLWDGHGHLLQYGEMLQSVDLFGSKSMEDVLARISLYQDRNPHVGTSTEWLRGIGWDQAAFGGKMPTSVSLNHNCSESIIIYSEGASSVCTSTCQSRHHVDPLTWCQVPNQSTQNFDLSKY
jgi:hypothetical protein